MYNNAQQPNKEKMTMFTIEDYKNLPKEFNEDDGYGYCIRVIECFDDFDESDESTYMDKGVCFKVDYVEGTDGDYRFIRVLRQDFEEWLKSVDAPESSYIFMLDCNEDGEELCFEIAPVAVTEEYVYFNRNRDDEDYQ